MPHYADGSPAAIGDFVKGPTGPGDKHILLGVVHTITPGSDTCNMQISGATIIVDEDARRVVLPQPPHNSYYATIKAFTKVAVFLVALIGNWLLTTRHCQAQWVRGRTYYTPQPQYRPAPAPQPKTSPLNVLKDGAGDRYNSGDVADMPTGTNKLYMTLVTSDDWQSDNSPRGKAQQTLVAWLQNDPRLKKYREQSNWNWYTETDPHFHGPRTLDNGQASSLKARLGEAFPILAIENPDGGTLFKMSALSLPGSAGELADWITAALKKQAVTSGIPGLTMPPDFRGKTQATPIRTEGGLHHGGNPPNAPHYGSDDTLQEGEGVAPPSGDRTQCGPDGCPFVKPAPHDDSDVIDDTTPDDPGQVLAYLLVTAGAIGAGGILAGASRIKPAAPAR